MAFRRRRRTKRSVLAKGRRRMRRRVKRNGNVLVKNISPNQPVPNRFQTKFVYDSAWFTLVNAATTGSQVMNIYPFTPGLAAPLSDTTGDAYAWKQIMHNSATGVPFGLYQYFIPTFYKITYKFAPDSVMSEVQLASYDSADSDPPTGIADLDHMMSHSRKIVINNQNPKANSLSMKGRYYVPFGLTKKQWLDNYDQSRGQYNSNPASKLQNICCVLSSASSTILAQVKLEVWGTCFDFIDIGTSS